MRSAALALALVACAPDDVPSQPRPHPATREECPLLGTTGVIGATWFPQTGCAYQCTVDRARVCGSRFEGGWIVGGTCAAFNDPQHCGECDRVCARGESCVLLGLTYNCLAR